VTGESGRKRKRKKLKENKVNAGSDSCGKALNIYEM
jgi:hypothetical protein